VWFNKTKVLYGGCLVKSIDAKDLEYVGEANIEECLQKQSRRCKQNSKPTQAITGHHDWSSTAVLNHTLSY
jgi:hypothetical protein